MKHNKYLLGWSDGAKTDGYVSKAMVIKVSRLKSSPSAGWLMRSPNSRENKQILYSHVFVTTFLASSIL